MPGSVRNQTLTPPAAHRPLCRPASAAVIPCSARHPACYDVPRNQTAFPKLIDEVLDESSRLHHRFRSGSWDVSVCYGAGARRSTGRLNRAMQRRQLHECSKKDGRMPRAQRCPAMVCRYIRSRSLCKDHEVCRRGSRNRVHASTTRSCCRSSRGPGTRPQGFLQHGQHHRSTRWRPRHGLGQHAHQCLSLLRLPLLWQNQGREVHDGSASQSCRSASDHGKGCGQ
jgi:hypothetical protein